MSAPRHGGQVYAAARRLGRGVSHILDFSASINPLGPSPKAIQRVRRELKLIRFYPDTEHVELGHLVAEQEKIDQNCILFGNGATQILHLIPRVLKPKKAVIVEPGFAEYKAALDAAGCRIHTLRLPCETNFRLEGDRLFVTIRRERPDLIILGNPNNPTGKTISSSLLLKLVERCEKQHIYLVLDESFIDFTSRRSFAADVLQRSYLLVVRSMTKFWALAGLRIGYVVAEKSLIKELSAKMEPWSVNSLASAAAAASLRDSKYRRATLALIQRERAFLIKQIAALSWLKPLPSKANFLLLRLEGRIVGSTELRDKLERRSILVRDGASFPGLGQQYIRIAVRNRRDNERLIQALMSIGRSSLGRKAP